MVWVNSVPQKLPNLTCIMAWLVSKASKTYSFDDWHCSEASKSTTTFVNFAFFSGMMKLRYYSKAVSVPVVSCFIGDSWGSPASCKESCEIVKKQKDNNLDTIS